MSILVPYNGSTFIIPTPNEIGWGTNLDNYLVAVSNGSLQNIGGNFTLSNDVDFGGTNGLKSLYYKTRSSNIASSGQFRLANAVDSINWRDSSNSADLSLTVNASNQLIFNGTPIGGLPLFTANRALITDGSGNVTTSSVTSTELSYLSGVTSAIQTQLNNKASLALDNLVSTSINADLIPATSQTTLLGSPTKLWRYEYLEQLFIGYPLVTQGLIHFTAADSSQVTIDSAGVANGAFYSLPNAGGSASFVLVPNFGTSGQVLTSTGATTAPTFQTPTGGGANTTLSNLGTTAINANLIPDTTDSYNIGSSSFEWNEIHARNFFVPNAQGIVFETSTKIYGNNAELVFQVGATTAAAIDNTNFEIGNGRVLTLDTDNTNKSRIRFINDYTSIYYDISSPAMRFTLQNPGGSAAIEYMTIDRSNDIVQFPTGSSVQNHSGAPSSPINGQIYWDSGDTHFYGWNGTTWKQLDN